MSDGFLIERRILHKAVPAAGLWEVVGSGGLWTGKSRGVGGGGGSRSTFALFMLGIPGCSLATLTVVLT